jgi:Tfp pilus assembly protein PilF
MTQRTEIVARRPVARHRVAVRLLSLAAVAWLVACSGATVSDDARAKADYGYRLASNYYADRNIAMTQRELHNALQQDPDHVQALNLRGLVRMGLKDMNGAVADFQHCLRVNPKFQEARNNLGSALIASGRHHEAIEVLLPLLEDPLYPTPAFAHGNVGWAYFQIENLSSARRHLEMAVFLNPRFCVGYNNLGQVHKALDNRRDAIAALEKATRTCPNYAEPFYHLGVIHQEAGDSERADEAFRTCAELAPDTAIGRRCAIRR